MSSSHQLTHSSVYFGCLLGCRFSMRVLRSTLSSAAGPARPLLLSVAIAVFALLWAYNLTNSLLLVESLV